MLAAVAAVGLAAGVSAWTSLGGGGQEGPTTRPRRVLRASVPTPTDVSSQDSVLDAYRKAAALGGCVSLPDPLEWWHAEQREFSDTRLGGASRWQKAVVGERRGEIFVQLDPYPPPRTGPLSDKLPVALRGQNFGSPRVREAFIAEAVARVRAYDARFVCLAMEINAYYEQNPEDFDNFVSLFVEARREIRRIRPDAIVFVSFQYEQLLGRFGGKAGMTVHEPHWELLEKFEPHADAVGISSYPWASFDPIRFGAPADLPADYYARLAGHTNRPIVFAELGWSSDPKYGGSEESQAEFLRRFGKMTEPLDLRLVNYFILHDTPIFGPVFESMGLYDRTGRPKAALKVWERLWTE